ncbi:hypothetical protein GCM10009619_09600 [Williamsia maris]
MSTKKLGGAVREAGKRIEARDEETANALKTTSDKAGGYPAVGQPASGVADCRPSDPVGKDAFLGKFPCSAGAETSPGGGVVEWGFGNSQPADPVSLNTLVLPTGCQWLEISPRPQRPLTPAFRVFWRTGPGREPPPTVCAQDQEALPI